MIRFLIFGLLLIHACLITEAQSTGTVKSIAFEGLNKTSTTYLLKYVTINEGDRFDSLLVETNRQRLVNLEILSNVTYEVDYQSDGAIITFHCTELFSLLPIINFGGIDDNFWFQGGFSEINLFGTGHKVTAYYQFYDRHSFVINGNLRRLNNKPWDLNFNLIKWSTLEPLFFPEGLSYYNYDNHTGGLTLTRHFTFNHRLEFGGALFQEKYVKAANQQSEPSPGPERALENKALIKLIHTVNHMNYHFYFVEGISNTTNIEAVYSFNQSNPFYIIFNDIKYFKRVRNRGNAAFRFRVGLSTNEESPFAPFVLDSYLNIRGVGDRVDRGTGTIVLNSEYRHAFIDKKWVAIQGVLFADTGTWRNPGGSLNDFSKLDNMVLFGGVGFRAIYKKAFNSILRIDYGFDLQDPTSSGYVIGIGQYF